MTKARILWWSVLAVGIVGLVAIWIDLIRPHPPLLDRTSAAYQARFEKAAELNGMNPGLSDETQSRVKAAYAQTLAKLRQSHPDASQAQFAEVEAILGASLDSFFEASARDVRHYWATYFSEDDMTLLVHRDEMPFWSTAHHRLRLFWTSHRYRDELQSLMAAGDEAQAARNREMIAETYRILTASQ